MPSFNFFINRDGFLSFTLPIFCLISSLQKIFLGCKSPMNLFSAFPLSLEGTMAQLFLFQFFANSGWHILYCFYQQKYRFIYCRFRHGYVFKYKHECQNSYHNERVLPYLWGGLTLLPSLKMFVSPILVDSSR